MHTLEIKFSSASKTFTRNYPYVNSNVSDLDLSKTSTLIAALSNDDYAGATRIIEKDISFVTPVETTVRIFGYQDGQELPEGYISTDSGEWMICIETNNLTTPLHLVVWEGTEQEPEQTLVYNGDLDENSYGDYGDFYHAFAGTRDGDVSRITVRVVIPEGVGYLPYNQTQTFKNYAHYPEG